MSKQYYTSLSVSETLDCSHRCIQDFASKKFFLIGELGSGKTHFAKGCFASFGIDAQEVLSPTYTYVKEYQIEGNTHFHFDLYRIANSLKADSFFSEYFEFFEETNCVIVEWADRLSLDMRTRCIQNGWIQVSLMPQSEQERLIEIFALKV